MISLLEDLDNTLWNMVALLTCTLRDTGPLSRAVLHTGVISVNNVQCITGERGQIVMSVFTVR